VSSPTGPVARECVEGYLFSRSPLRLLVLRRPPARGRFWVPVSGKVEPNDADFEAAVRREVAEETGFVRPLSVFALDWHVPFVADNGETWRLHAYAVEVEPGQLPTLGPEHDAFEWLDPDAAIARLHFPDNQEAVRRLLARLATGGNV
jgi:lipoyl(octanoyl) transferase